MEYKNRYIVTSRCSMNAIVCSYYSRSLVGKLQRLAMSVK